MSTHNMTEVLVGGVVLACAVAFGVYASQSTGLSQGSAGYGHKNNIYRGIPGRN